MRIYDYSYDCGSDLQCPTVTIKLSDVNNQQMLRIRSLASRGDEIKIERDDWTLPLTATDILRGYIRSDIERTEEMFKIRFVDIKVEKVIFNKPATIVFWSDGTKTVVKCGENDEYDAGKGFFIACAKKLFGNDYRAVGRMNKALEMAIVQTKLERITMDDVLLPEEVKNE